MTPQQTVTALAIAALNNDPEGLALLLVELSDDEVRAAAGYALLNTCNAFRTILTEDAWAEVITGMQALAAQEASQ